MDVKNLLNELVKISGNEFASIVSEGTSGDITDYIDTGCYLLNAQISGDIYKGIPTNRTIGIAGPESCGKTFFSLAISKNFLKKEPDGILVIFDSENAYSDEMFIERKMDISRIMHIPVETVEEFRTQALNIINHLNGKENVKALFVLDSLGSLSSKKETDDIEKGESKVDMTRQKMIRGAFRVLNIKLAKHKIPLIVTNHTYDEIGSFVGGQVIAGGGGLKYAASIILTLTKAQYKEDEKISGFHLTATTYKSRLTRERTKAKTLLHFIKGLYPYSGLLEILMEENVWVKDGHSIRIDENTKVKEKDILCDPKKYFTEEVMNKVNIILKDKFSYGSSLDNSESWINEAEVETEDEEIENKEIKEDNLNEETIKEETIEEGENTKTEKRGRKSKK